MKPSPNRPGVTAHRASETNADIRGSYLDLMPGDWAVGALGDQFRKAPGFLRYAPIAISLDDLGGEQVDFPALRDGRVVFEKLMGENEGDFHAGSKCPDR